MFCTFISVLVNYDIATVGTSCAAGDLSMNSSCYTKFHSSSPLTWYSANNFCFFRGGFLATFTNIGRIWKDSQLLTGWLNSSGTDKTYWIGLVRAWMSTTNEGNT